MRRLVPLILASLALCRVAHADIALSPNRLGARITNADQHADYVIAVYPWSASNGEPGAEVAGLSKDALMFGRRIDGTPHLYALTRHDFARARGAQELPKSGVVDCGIEIDQNAASTAPITGPIRPGGNPVIAEYRIERVGADGCKLQLANADAEHVSRKVETPKPATRSPAPASAPPRDTSGCSACRASRGQREPAAPLWLVPVALLFARRRRR